MGFCVEIFIVAHSKFYGKLVNYVNKHFALSEEAKIEVIPVDGYYGTVSSLLAVRPKLRVTDQIQISFVNTLHMYLFILIG